MDTDTFLNDEERASVVAFVGNKKAFEAVRKVLLFSIYGNGVLKPGEPAKAMFNWALHITNNNPDAPNDILGEKLRAKAEAVNDIESAFQKLGEFMPKVEKPAAGTNPAL